LFQGGQRPDLGDSGDPLGGGEVAGRVEDHPLGLLRRTGHQQQGRLDTREPGHPGEIGEVVVVAGGDLKLEPAGLNRLH